MVSSPTSLRLVAALRASSSPSWKKGVPVNLVSRPGSRNSREEEAELTALFRSLELDWRVEVDDGHVRVTGPQVADDRSLALSAVSTVAGIVDVQIG